MTSSSSHDFSQSPFDARGDASKTFLTFNQKNQQIVKEKDTLLDKSTDDVAYYDDDEITKAVSYNPSYDLRTYKRDASMSFYDCVYKKLMKLFNVRKPSFDRWINSWSVRKIPVRYWLSVYGCIDDLGHGGYGVIIRDIWSEPIIAATCYTKEGRSQLFQVLNGLKTGLTLAAKLQSSHVEVVCNMRKAVKLLGSSTFQEAGDCLPYLDCDNTENHAKTKGVCMKCTNCRVCIPPASLESLIDVINEIKILETKVDEICGFSKVPLQGNEAAYYLANMARQLEPHDVKYCRILVPCDFPLPLKEILYSDAFDFTTRYSFAVFSKFVQSEMKRKQNEPARNH